MPKRPVIAVSSCILGHRVRYDAQVKHFPSLLAFINHYFEPVSVCPEVAIGLSVPRPALQLMAAPDQPQMVGRDDPDINVTAAMQQFCQQRPDTLHDICGYIFKSRSPSCGLHNIPVFNGGEIIDSNSRGLFARAMVELYPELPVIEETGLLSAQQREQFIQQVLNYYKKHTG